MGLGLEYFNLILGSVAAVLGLVSVVALFEEQLPRLYEVVFILDLALIPASCLSMFWTLQFNEPSFDAYHGHFPVVGAGGLTETHFWGMALTYWLPLIGFVLGSKAKNMGYLG